MKQIYKVLFFLFSIAGYSQDISMQNGTFNRCAPDRFFDSGGEFGNYGNSENLITTICPENSGEFIILDFTQFVTQLNLDVMNVYDGDNVSANLIGSFTGPEGAFSVSASDTNTTGCLTVEFISNASGPADGWQADILCATACQNIVAHIDSTVPAQNGTGVISILPGETVDFSGSATFSDNGANASYTWDFGDGNTSSGTNVSNTFFNDGTFTVTLTVTDDNPQGCSDTISIIVFVLGPNVIVDQDIYTPEQLIEDVLINSPCASVSNVIWSTGTSFSSNEPNGIGYFYGNGIDFPFADGVILTTGNASQASGPNATNMGAGTTFWPGDADLDLRLGVSSNNATFIQFDFTPLADNISFEFLMASEEYDMGSFECNFSDAFAFLLTDSNGNTSNLAVIPGTNTPILVTNIHPFNGFCPAINEQYFGEYFPLFDPNTPIAFDGRTTVFTAQSPVIPGENYTIKLVIADDRDASFDSGVFLKAGSFDLGGDLGEDITIAAGTAACNGDPIRLNTGISTASHTWYFNGVEIPGVTNSTIEVTETGTYSVDIVFTGVCQTSDSVFVEFRPNPIANTPQNLVVCDTDGTAEFDLSLNNDSILGTQNPADFQISYHLTEQDAIDNIGALPVNYTNTSSPQTIWARLADNSQVCFEVVSFQLQFTGLDIVSNVPPLRLCDDSTADGFRAFNLTDRNPDIIGANDPADVVVTFYKSLIDAENSAAPLPEMYVNTTPVSETVFARLELTANSQCYNITTFDLEVLVNPTVNVLTDFVVCDDASNDGVEVFDLSTRNFEVLGPQTGMSVSYYESLSDAESAIGALPILYTNTVPGGQEVYARIEDNVTGCYATTTLQLIVNPSPTIAEISPYELCDATNPGDGQEVFDLSIKDIEVIDGQVNVSVAYFANQEDADMGVNSINGPYSNISNPQSIIAVLTNNQTGCSSSLSFNLVVDPLPAIVAPMALEVCDDGVPDGLTAIDLSLKNTEITGNNPDYAVSYYETLADAQSGTNVLPTLYTNTSNPQTIYVRVEDIGTGCYDTTLLDLVVQQAPVANIPAPFTYCDPDNDGFGEFILTDLDNEITGGVAGVSVTYHDTFANADTNAAAIDTSIPYSNIVINTQIVYARVESTTIATNCASIVPVELIVYPSPEVPTILSDYLLCDDNNDGILQFDLNTKTAEILGAQDPTALVLSYHVSASDAQTGNNPIINTGNYTNTSNPQVIYVRLFNPLTGCQDTGLFNIEAILPPVAVQATPLEQCDDLGEVGDELTVFDLTVKDTEITGGNGSWSVAYYETDADAQAQANAIADPTQYTNTSVNGLPANPQTLYAVVTDTDTGCIDFTTLTIRVLPNPSPTPSALLPDLELCDANNIGDGQEDFDLTQNELLILNGETGVTASYYETASDAHAGINPIPDPTVYTNIQSPEQIHVRVTNDLTGCYTLVDFTIRVNPLPEVVAVTDFIQCELNTDGFDSFDLTTKTAEVLAGQDPSLFTVSYHESLTDAQALLNGLVSPYTNQSNPQQIFVAITNTVTGCSIATQTFTIEVQEAAQANPDTVPIVYEVCDDNMETDGDPSNDSVQFDLATQDADILDGQDPSNYIVSYYATEEDANLNVNPLPLLYENLSNPQVIYARVDNNTPDGTTGLDSSICYAVTPLTLQVNPLPEFSLEQSYTLCINSNGTEVINPPIIATGLSEQDYSFEWRFNGEVLALETSSSLVPNQAGSYQVIVTHANTGCVNDTEVGITEVIESDPPSLELNLVTQAFAENHVIEAIAIGNGDYEYSLDGGPWQDSNIFTDVSPGIRVITARDKNGCGLAEAELLVIDYPLYFTPNGDGTNDTWNIVGIDTQPNAKIYIFDRYGKLLKQLSPLGNGWNGTFNGNAMPSSDYWFTVDYNEPSTGDRKTFNAHFTLKR